MLQGRHKDTQDLSSDTRTAHDTLDGVRRRISGAARSTPRADWIASHPKEVQALTNAIIATLKWIHTHSPEEIVGQDA